VNHVDVNLEYQIEYHPFVLSHLTPVLAIHEQHGIRTESFGPLTPLVRHPTGGGPLVPVLKRIADRLTSEYDRTIEPATVLLLWTRAMGVVTVSASKNPKRIKWLAEVAKLSGDMLTDEEVNEITEVGKTIHFRHYVSFRYFVGDWDSRD
jgi:diketogulonate reductase-like aldo/keto reductase